MMFISTKTLSGETFIAYMEDFPFVTHASWTLSYDCDTVKKIIFLCSLRVLVYNERISVQPSIRSERMFVSFFSFSQNEWLEFQLHTDKRLSVFKCLSMRLWGCVIVCAPTDPLRKEQSQDHTNPDLWPHQEWPIMPRQGQRAGGTQTWLSDCRRYHDWFTYCSSQQPCYRPFSSMEQTWVLIRRMTDTDTHQDV